MKGSSILSGNGKAANKLENNNIGLFTERIKTSPLVIIYRGLESGDCLEITSALAEAGVRCFEVTMNTQGAVRTIKLLREAMGPEIQIGAGTVLTSEQVRQVTDAGAGFIISPNVKESVIQETKRSRLISIPGAFTPTEIIKAWECGADMVKVFPVNVVGSEYIRQLRGPLQDIPFMATGGITLDLVGDLFGNGVNAIGLSAHLLGRELVEKKDWQALKQSAKRFMSATGRYQEEDQE